MMTGKAKPFVALSLLASAGLLIGRFAAIAGVVPAHADSCSIDRRDFSDAAQSITDNDDGESNDNRWSMHAGRDDAKTLACDDGTMTEYGVYGQDQNDDVGGGSGADWVSGGQDNDTVLGGTNPFFTADNLFGGDGSDDVEDQVDGTDRDIASGGDGPDIIDLQDSDGEDTADAGLGEDTCYLDSGDFRSGCEHTP
jgi:hypothetical protein